ncbi:MAG: type II secretion system protein [Trichlorobacter sp.]|uniref:secretin N-terminal domain-containing protein n=1 Tax=Trichlorobacter sp. TaxID=2911007 RepID=UPI00255D971C|nr:secretin N-terminal domain-containing protein [Trichlorobacter sp.]MDK9716652.1 type II secretion system protein [Trichlorobacter sp.]
MTRPLYIIVALVTLMALSGCSAARKNYNEGKDLEEQGKLEEAMYRYAEAVKHAPDESEYRMKFLNTRMAAAKGREQEGDALVKAGNYAGAVTAYQTAAGLDGSQPRLVQKATNAIRLRDAAAAYQEGLALEKGNKLREAATAYGRALDLAAENKEYATAALRIAGLRKSKLDGFELQLKSKQPITLRFRETRLKDIFSVVSQLSGINFIFDPDVKDQSVTITLENATFQQATDLLAGMYKLGHKVLNETTVLIYPHSAEKTKQYQDMQLRTFHLNHLDAKKAANLIRTMLQVRRLYINEDANALVVRDTRDINDVIEKILEANDQPDAEVVLDVEVIEISDKDSKNFGLLLSDYNVQLGAFKKINGQQKLLATTLKDTTTTSSASTTTTTEASVDNLVQVFKSGVFGGYVTVPNAQYNFGKTLANGEVLSNPKLRVKNKEKAKFNVGTRVPITTTTMATTGTTSQVNVQYVDVGVKVNAEPTIQLNNEISIKLGLEVSSIISRETVGGKDSATTVVTIGTRNLDTVLSLKDGETSVIGGLIANSKSDSKQKIFLLGDIPLIGPLLSNTKTDNDKTELILAITPRLVRGVTVQSRKVTSFISGKEDDPSITPPYASFEQEPEYAAPAAPPVKAPPVPAIKPQPPQGMPPQPSNRLAPLPAPPLKTAPVPSQQLSAPVPSSPAGAMKSAAPTQAPQPPPVRKSNGSFKMTPPATQHQNIPAPPQAVPKPLPKQPVSVTPTPVPLPIPPVPEPPQPPPAAEPDPAPEAVPPPESAVTPDL